MASNEARKHSHEATQSKGHLQALELHKNLSENRAEQESNTTERDQTHRKREAEREIAELAKTKDELIRPASEVKQVDLHKSKEDKEYGFKATMHTVRKNMSAPEKQFSKFIHRPVIEKASEIAGNTVARPSGIAGAAIAAFIGLLSLYGIAKFVGFTLSGSEMPLLLLFGFALGIIAEWVFKSIRSMIRPIKE
ncbi:hypothetical protein KA021_01070 [Candidatus Saccharibacteria bacterium]|jgi:hypothetical protein|nr:hypothetical protein [Candidatus Saccharibacteria bacterium]